MRTNIVFDYHELSAQHLTELGIRVYSRYVFEFVSINLENSREILTSSFADHEPSP
jgi:hypothetical protein